VATDDVINAAERAATVTVTGTNEAGATVTLNGNATTVVDATHWSYNLSAAQINAFGQGAETLTAVSTDAAANTTTSTRDISVDTLNPAVSSEAITSAAGIQNSTLNAGDVASVTVTMSEAVTVTGTPQLALNIGGTTVQANYASGSGGNTLVFNYTILAGQTDANGIALGANALSLNGGTITDAAGNAATLTAAAVTDNASYKVDTTAPTVSSEAITSAAGIQNSTLNAGDVASVTVTMSEAVTVTGTPQLALNIGGTTVQANYASGSGSSALVFNYTVQAGQTDANGVSINANALSLNGGTITDLAGNAATLTAAAVTDNASYKVDTTAPTVSSEAITSAAGIQNSTLNAGDVASVTVTMSEAMTVTGTPQLALNIGGHDRAGQLRVGQRQQCAGVQLHRAGGSDRRQRRQHQCQRAEPQRRHDHRSRGQCRDVDGCGGHGQRQTTRWIRRRRRSQAWHTTLLHTRSRAMPKPAPSSTCRCRARPKVAAQLRAAVSVSSCLLRGAGTRISMSPRRTRREMSIWPVFQARSIRPALLGLRSISRSLTQPWSTADRRQLS
jgi:hypothetical protein